MDFLCYPVIPNASPFPGRAFDSRRLRDEVLVVHGGIVQTHIRLVEVTGVRPIGFRYGKGYVVEP